MDPEPKAGPGLLPEPGRWRGLAPDPAMVPPRPGLVPGSGLEAEIGLATEVGLVKPGTLTGPAARTPADTGSGFLARMPPPPWPGTLCLTGGRLLVDCRGCLLVILT